MLLRIGRALLLQAPIATENPGCDGAKHAALRCRRLINIAHIPKELTADQANLFDPYLVHPERGIAALDSIVGRDLSRP
jgi:hypothetical protein